VQVSSKTHACAERLRWMSKACLVFGNGVDLAGSGELVPNWLGSEDGSGLKASVSATCGLRGCLAPHAILAMLGISKQMKCNHEII
jgi:hypothetical protein